MGNNYLYYLLFLALIGSFGVNPTSGAGCAFKTTVTRSVSITNDTFNINTVSKLSDYVRNHYFILFSFYYL